MISVKKDRYFWVLVFGLFCIVFNPPLLPINSMHVVGLFSIIYILLYGKYSFRISKEIFKTYVSFFFLVVYLFFICMKSAYGDINALLSPIYFLIDILPFAFVCKNIGEKKGYEKSDYIDLIVYVAIIQAVLAIMSLIIPSFHTILINRFVAYGYRDVYTRISTFRMYGFAGGLTFATPVFLSFFSIVELYRSISEKKMMHFLVTIILFLAAIINARTSIIVLMLGFIVLIFVSDLSLTKKILLLIVEFFVVIFIFSTILPIVQQVSPLTYEWISEGFEEIIVFFSGNRNQGYFSYLYSINQYPIPVTILELIFGTGHDVFGRNSMLKFGVATDIGYINDLWKGGIIYCIFLYGFIISTFIKFIKSNNRIYKFIGIFAFFTYPFLMIKGAVCNMCDITNTLFILHIVNISDISKREKENE